MATPTPPPTPEDAAAAYTDATAAFNSDKTFDNLNDMCTKGIKKFTANIDTAISTNKKDDLLAQVKIVKDFFDLIINNIKTITATPDDKAKIANIYKIRKEGADSLAKLLALADKQKDDLTINDEDTVLIESVIDYLNKIDSKPPSIDAAAVSDDKPPAGDAADSGAEQVAKYKELLKNLTGKEEILTALANAVATSIQTLDKANTGKPATAAGGTQRVGTKKRKRRKRRGKGTGKNKPLSEVNVVL